MTLHERLQLQTFGNGYELVDGVQMHEENGDRFQIPHPVLKKHVSVGHFVEVRIDSPRFSMHPDAPEKCTCSACNGEASKPVLSHEQPASLVPIPEQNIPSRGWGEDFWVQVTQREADTFLCSVDNPLYESRLHGLSRGDGILIHSNHILAVHPTHRQEMVMSMDESDLRMLIEWLGTI